MTKLLSSFFFLLALAPLAAADDVLFDRLRPVASGRDVAAVEYSFYPSGRPELVVAAHPVEEWLGEVFLVRFPDRDDGQPVVLQHLKLDEKPTEVALVRAVDAKDILVTCFARHSPPGYLYRVAGERLVQLAVSSLYWDFIAVDLDGDHIPELIESGCCDRTPSGTHIRIYVQKYDGTEYKNDGRHYFDFIPADGHREKSLPIPPPFDGVKRRISYTFHIINGGANSARVQLDGQDLVPPATLRHFTRVAASVDLDTPESADDCHTLAITSEGPPESEVYVLIEEQHPQ